VETFRRAMLIAASVMTLDLSIWRLVRHPGLISAVSLVGFMIVIAVAIRTHRRPGGLFARDASAQR